MVLLNRAKLIEAMGENDNDHLIMDGEYKKNGYKMVVTDGEPKITDANGMPKLVIEYDQKDFTKPVDVNVEVTGHGVLSIEGTQLIINDLQDALLAANYFAKIIKFDK